MFLGTGALKIRSKFIGEHICRRIYNSSVILLHIFRTPFPKNTSAGLLLVGDSLFQQTLGEICQNSSFLWLVFSRIRQNRILSFYGKIRVRDNLNSEIFYAVKRKFAINQFLLCKGILFKFNPNGENNVIGTFIIFLNRGVCF